MPRLGSLRHAFPARLSGALLLAGLAWLAAVSPWASATPLAYADSVITVNSDGDNVDDDGVLTLREAICLAIDTSGGTTPIGAGTDCAGGKSDAQRTVAKPAGSTERPGRASDRIRFSGNFTIEVDCANLDSLPFLDDSPGGFWCRRHRRRLWAHREDPARLREQARPADHAQQLRQHDPRHPGGPVRLQRFWGRGHSGRALVTVWRSATTIRPATFRDPVRPTFQLARS